MARKESMHALMNRWDRIFDGIKAGKSASEIYRREGIIAQRRYDAWANRRGERFQDRFENAVKNLFFVEEVTPTVKNSDEDYHQKIDFWVVCRFGDGERFPVCVQVKPNEKEIRRFLKTYVNEKVEVAWEIVVDRGMVVIDVDKGIGKIKKDFTTQVLKIKDRKKIG